MTAGLEPDIFGCFCRQQFIMSWVVIRSSETVRDKGKFAGSMSRENLTFTVLYFHVSTMG